MPFPAVYAAAREARIRHDLSRLNVACSSTSRPRSRAPTTRKCRGRKSSMVLPSRYCSTTAGLTYDDRATAGVFPSRSGDVAHHCRNSLLCLGGILRRLVLGELDRGEQRPAPRPEVLGGVAVAEIALHVVVELALAEVAMRPIRELVLEQPRPGHGAQVANRSSQLGVDDGAPHHDRVLAAVAERDARAANAHVALPERRDAERARLLCVAVAADAEPAEIDQAGRRSPRPCSAGKPSSSMCSAIVARRSGSRSANPISRSYFACSCRARKAGWYRYCFLPAASTPVAWSLRAR